MGRLQAATRDFSTQHQVQESHMTNAMTLKVVEGWEQLPKGSAHCGVAGLSVDQEDCVLLFC
jgi:hypothetical protein